MQANIAQINVILLFCGIRSGRFGQGTFMQSLLPYFKTKPNMTVTLIKTDCSNISEISYDKEDDMDIIAIPHIQHTSILTGENNPIQKTYAKRIIGIIYTYLKDKPNLLFWVNSIDYLNLCCDLKKVFNNCKLMYVHHSFSWKYYMNAPDNVFIQKWKKGEGSFHPKAFEMTRYQQEMALISDIVITVTNHAKDFFINILDIPASKVVTIYNGRSVPNRKEESRYDLRKKYGFNRSEKIILFSGRVTKDKGFPELLKAFKLFADKNKKAKLVVMGAGGLLDYTALAKPHWSKIIYTGELEQQQVNEFYRLADVGVIPSLHEQCSFTAIEMRLHKLPVIVSGVDGLDELFLHEQDSLKLSLHISKTGEKELDEKEFADHIERLISDRKLSNRLSINSYKKALKLFTDEVMWKQYDEVFSNIFD